MKKTIITVMCAASLSALAEVKTNYVYVVSNIFNNVYTESVITQKIKNTHFNYFYTNHVSTIENIFERHYHTNVTVNVDVADRYLSDVKSYRDLYVSYLNEASAKASAAGSSASAAAASVAQAENARQGAEDIVSGFDLHAQEILSRKVEESYIYTNGIGEVFSYVHINLRWADSFVAVDARSAGEFSTDGIRVVSSAGGGHWDFYPAYIDFDAAGMRLNYLPREPVPLNYGDSEGNYPNGLIVPEAFYWQDGWVYLSQRVWVDGRVVASATTRYEWPLWPSAISGPPGASMQAVARENFGGETADDQLATVYTISTMATAGAQITFPFSPSPSHEPTLEWMRFGPGESQLEQGWPQMVVDVDGKVHSNLIWYSRAAMNGKVAVTEYRPDYYVSPRLSGMYIVSVPSGYGGSLENSVTFGPGYVSTDMEGLRLNFVPTTKSVIAGNAANFYVVREFYWQKGYLWSVCDHYDSATNWVGRLRTKQYQSTARYTYPNVFGVSSSGTTMFASFQELRRVSHEGTVFAGAMTSQMVMKFGCEPSAILPTGSTLWFPENLAPEQQSIVDWLATFPYTP